MERFTISLDDQLAAQFDQLIRERGYDNRSEAVRDLIRSRLNEQRLAEDTAPYCVATLSYVYRHHELGLSERVAELQHQHHDLVVATTHVHLDHDHCLETAILRGRTAAVRQFAEGMMAERGIRHGQLNLIPVDNEGGSGHMHSHPGV